MYVEVGTRFDKQKVIDLFELADVDDLMSDYSFRSIFHTFSTMRRENRSRLSQIRHVATDIILISNYYWTVSS